MCPVHFETLGCKLNQIETESAASAFIRAGFPVDMEPVSAGQDSLVRGGALLCIVNTCTVTGKAEQKARRLVRLLLNIYPSACVLVTGCYAQLEKNEIEALGSRVRVLPGARKDSLVLLPQYLLEAGDRDICSLISEWGPVSADGKDACGGRAGDMKIPPAENVRSAVSGCVPQKKTRIAPAAEFSLTADTFLRHSRGAVKIQDGCNNSCSYCRIRLARGKSVSLPVAEVLERVRRIEAAGQREIVLTGVNLSQYSGDSGDGVPVGLDGLLRILLENTSSVSFRISSLYPERVDDALCRVLSHPRVRPHFHLSVQSGSDAVLAAMRRPYRAAAVYAAAERLRRVKDNPFLACDIISGFPGETDADFELTRRMCADIAFAGIHAFPFSPRPGTPAFSMKNRVPQRVAGERTAILGELARGNRVKYTASWTGRQVKAVIEKDSHGGSGAVFPVKAVTENYLHIIVDGTSDDARNVSFLNAGEEVSVIIAGPPVSENCDARAVLCG